MSRSWLPYLDDLIASAQKIERLTAARTAASASVRLVTSTLTAIRSVACPRAFDTRAVDALSGSAVSGVFVLNMGFASAPPLNIAGAMRDDASLPLEGALVALRRYETVFW